MTRYVPQMSNDKLKYAGLQELYTLVSTNGICKMSPFNEMQKWL